MKNEVAQFGIRVLLAQPGAHRTNIVTASEGNNVTKELIPDYDAMRMQGFEKYKLQNGKQPGDPEKAMLALADVVRGEGLAEGKEMPLWLVLGTDAEQNLRDYMAERLQNLDEWVDVTRSTTFPGKDFVLV